MEALSRPVQQLRRPGPRWLQSGAAALKRATSLNAVRAAGILCESDGGVKNTRTGGPKNTKQGADMEHGGVKPTDQAKT